MRAPSPTPPRPRGRAGPATSPTPRHGRRCLAAGSEELCSACHADVMADMNTPQSHNHTPAEEGRCLECHSPHVSEHPGLTRQGVPMLCWTCHDSADPVMQEKHLGLVTTETDCSSCHAPHSSTGPGLFWPNAHPPFTEGSCDDCHIE